MNDNSSYDLRELQALRLVRAFLRIHDVASRNKLVELAERIAEAAQSDESR
ncbi:hypothetical protein [Bradyrhizobium pachyrhizi]|uniref:hypothetical protein n=1 Tax=Bradyrhizobium pachyrhizi TaxID=280333 RepID=UPI000A79AD25|nr:hypothetical protein [Bradyrhizobium pachyrhizi]